MGGSNFDQIAQALLEQQQILQNLQAENKQLHQQLRDLRAGQGISILINGAQFPLAALLPSDQSTNSSSEEEHSLPSVTSVTPVTSVATDSTPSPELAEQATTTIPAPVASSEVEQVPQSVASDTAITPAATTTAPSADSTESTVHSASASPTAASSTTNDDDRPSFLEDLMINEFSSAMTSPLHAQKTTTSSSSHDEPATSAEPSTGDSVESKEEAQKADLRRALIGSYVLD
jgi:hypothetical protein